MTTREELTERLTRLQANIASGALSLTNTTATGVPWSRDAVTNLLGDTLSALSEDGPLAALTRDAFEAFSISHEEDEESTDPDVFGIYIFKQQDMRRMMEAAQVEWRPDGWRSEEDEIAFRTGADDDDDDQESED